MKRYFFIIWVLFVIMYRNRNQILRASEKTTDLLFPDLSPLICISWCIIEIFIRFKGINHHKL